MGNCVDRHGTATLTNLGSSGDRSPPSISHTIAEFKRLTEAMDLAARTAHAADIHLGGRYVASSTLHAGKCGKCLDDSNACYRQIERIVQTKFALGMTHRQICEWNEEVTRYLFAATKCAFFSFRLADLDSACKLHCQIQDLCDAYNALAIMLSVDITRSRFRRKFGCSMKVREHITFDFSFLSPKSIFEMRICFHSIEI